VHGVLRRMLDGDVARMVSGGMGIVIYCGVILGVGVRDD